ncbi:MAG: hypothetical protein H0X50_06145 [Nitrosopumilus sp.]|nr:hypothetical protein [Nitrosopumilus sp.]
MLPEQGIPFAGQPIRFSLLVKVLKRSLHIFPSKWGTIQKIHNRNIKKNKDK